MKHPFQLISTDRANKYLYVAVKQTLQVFNLETKELVKSWDDELDASYILAKQQLEKIVKLKEQGIDKIPKIPKPGVTAPKINNFIRNLLVTENYVIITTDTDKLCVIFHIDRVDHIRLIKRVELPKRPCSIIVDSAEKNLILGDKFGDVYCISLDPEVETPAVDGLTPILGHVSMLTNLNSFVKDGQEFIVSTDRDEHIKISKYPKSYLIETFLFEHLNFISTTLITNDLKLLSGGGDDFICFWDLSNFQLLKKIDLRQFYPDVEQPVVLKIVQFAHRFIVVLEKSPVLLILDENFRLETKLECSSNIVDVFANDSQLIASLEEASLQIITVENSQFQSQKDDQLILNSKVEVKDVTEVIPLFNVSNLRKYSEKYT